jgi:hypothetical protein
MKNQPNHNPEASFEKKVFLKAMRDRGFEALMEMTQTEQIQVVNWAQEVFNQYRTVVDEHPEKIKNSYDLPFPKEEIRIAIKVLLPAYLDQASTNTLNELKEKYVALGYFQDPDLSENVVMDLVMSEQKVLQEDINVFINDLPTLGNKA